MASAVQGACTADPVYCVGRGYWLTPYGYFPRQRYPVGYRLPNGALLDAMTGVLIGMPSV
jgi:hypothetical protein